MNTETLFILFYEEDYVYEENKRRDRYRSSARFSGNTVYHGRDGKSRLGSAILGRCPYSCDWSRIYNSRNVDSQERPAESKNKA